MKTSLHHTIAASAVATLAVLAAGSAFAQVTGPGAGTTATPALRPLPPHIDKPGDHPRGAPVGKPDAAAGADNPQVPALSPVPPHVDRPGDHPRTPSRVTPNTAAGAGTSQTPAHVDKPGMPSDHKH